jgi:DNA-binding GntR family transcriptional regulator
MPPESTPARQSLAEETYSRIRRALVDGGFEPGQKVSEPELALKFSTSRSPVREALVRLELEGFVSRQANGRLTVRALDVSDLRQLYVVRSRMEGLAARLAAPLLRTVDLEYMGRKLDEMEQCVKKSNAEGALVAGQEFHDVLIRECANQALVDVLAGLRARISRYRAVVASLGDYDKERVTEHRRILKALYQRDAETAELEVIRHVERSAGVLVDKLAAKWQQDKPTKTGRKSGRS